MEKIISFEDLVRKTCLKIIWHFSLSVFFLYFFPLATFSGEMFSPFSDGMSEKKGAIFLSAFSWMYLCVCLILIVGFHIRKMLRHIKREMEIVYYKSRWKKDEEKEKKLILREFYETNQRLDEMQKQIKEMIEKEKKQKEELIFKVSAASHDLKTPLTVMRGNAELLLYSSLKDDQKQCVEDMVEAGKKLTNYFNSLISYSKTFYDDRIGWEDHDVSEITKAFYQECLFVLKEPATFEFFNYTEGKGRKKVNLSYLLRALSNLLENAREYANPKDSGILINIEEDIEEDKEDLILSVENHGSAFSSELLEHGVQLFYRGEKERNSEKSHYGIGLAFVDRVAYLHSGALQLENTGRGVRVILRVKG